jgi:hypothetical protein
MLSKEQLKKIVQWPIINRIYHRYIYFQNWRNRKFTYAEQPMDMLYKLEDLTPEYYEKMKDIGGRKLEHQIGRLTNFKQIVKACTDMEGDFIEFGCWRGFSLLWLGYFMERNALFNRKLIGIDGFVGIPYAEGSFHKGLFKDTSLKSCRNNVLNNKLLYIETRQNILIAQYLYKEKDSIIRYLRKNNIDKLCFIHIDCDVSKSAIEIFEILNEGNFIADKAYIVFDDWGCDCNLPETAHKIFQKMKADWTIKEHASTKVTKTFFFQKK